MEGWVHLIMTLYYIRGVYDFLNLLSGASQSPWRGDMDSRPGKKINIKT